MSDLLSIGLSGLGTSQTWLTVTGHNITNVKTPGYSRQDAIQQTRIPQFSGAGYMGSGSQIVDVRRLASDFLTGQLRNATSQNSELNAFLGQIDQLNSLLADNTTGVSPAMQRFFSALQTAAQNPSSTEAREAVLAQAQGLSKTFNTLYDQLDKQNSLINQQLGALTSQVNNLSQSVAEYNDAIAKAKSAGAVPNDLLDARDEAVRKLSEMVGVTAVTQDDNSVSLFIGSGQPLVVGNTVSTLSVVPGLDDPTRYQVQLTLGDSTQNVTRLVSGGQMGGLLAYRDTVLDSSYNKLRPTCADLRRYRQQATGAGPRPGGQGRRQPVRRHQRSGHHGAPGLGEERQHRQCPRQPEHHRYQQAEFQRFPPGLRRHQFHRAAPGRRRKHAGHGQRYRSLHPLVQGCQRRRPGLQRDPRPTAGRGRPLHPAADPARRQRYRDDPEERFATGFRRVRSRRGDHQQPRQRRHRPAEPGRRTVADRSGGSAERLRRQWSAAERDGQRGWQDLHHDLAAAGRLELCRQGRQRAARQSDAEQRYQQQRAHGLYRSGQRPDLYLRVQPVQRAADRRQFHPELQQGRHCGQPQRPQPECLADQADGGRYRQHGVYLQRRLRWPGGAGRHPDRPGAPAPTPRRPCSSRRRTAATRCPG